MQDVSPWRDLLIATDHLTILNASLFRELRQPVSGRRNNQAFLVRFGIELALFDSPGLCCRRKGAVFLSPGGAEITVSWLTCSVGSSISSRGYRSMFLHRPLEEKD
ncbi:hypothetical protein, partial [Pseudomonas viridiflava]|uniref:hypothetical protein n=1 Tax=Pseudomonas viridiflava TaxID=33069 RepID=UPI001CA9D619